MLAIADSQGIVSASVPGLADVSRVDTESCRRAIGKLSERDPDSRTQEHNGKRIEPIDGGWRILNYLKYRRMLNEEERREYKAKWARDKRRQNVDNVDGCGHRQKQKQSTEADNKEKKSAATQTVVWSAAAGFEGISSEIHQKWRIAFPACNIDRQLAAMDEWLRCNPAKAKKSNWRRFVTNWLQRSQDRGGDCPSYRQPKDFSAVNYDQDRQSEREIAASRQRVAQLRKQLNGQ